MRTLVSDTWGVKTWVEGTEDGLLTHYEQDAEPVLDLNKRKRDAGRAYYAQDPDLHRVASIPNGVALQWYVKWGVEAWNPEHIDRVRKLLNDPEWRYLKTAEVII